MADKSLAEMMADMLAGKASAYETAEKMYGAYNGKPCPCIGCETRKYFARVFDMHWHDGEDCPYECPMHNEWKEGVYNGNV